MEILILVHLIRLYLHLSWMASKKIAQLIFLSMSPTTRCWCSFLDRSQDIETDCLHKLTIQNICCMSCNICLLQGWLPAKDVLRSLKASSFLNSIHACKMMFRLEITIRFRKNPFSKVHLCINEHVEGSHWACPAGPTSNQHTFKNTIGLESLCSPRSYSPILYHLQHQKYCSAKMHQKYCRILLEATFVPFP